LPARSTPPDRKSGGDTRDRTPAAREAAPYVGLGLTLAVTVLVGLAGGYWLDGRLGTRPVFLLLGGTVGLGAALYHLFKVVAAQGKRHSGPKQ
jgi:F0F1-type ATP synthase assembly protein I